MIGNVGSHGKSLLYYVADDRKSDERQRSGAMIRSYCNTAVKAQAKLVTRLGEAFVMALRLSIDWVA